MRQRILDLASEWRYLSFAQLEEHLGDLMQGDLALTLTGYDNIILWHGVNEAFVEAMKDLLDHDMVRLCPTTPLTYMCDGKVLNLPTAKRLYPYRRLHWLPVTLDVRR